MDKLLCQCFNYLRVATWICEFSVFSEKRQNNGEHKYRDKGVTIAHVNSLTLDVRARFVKPDKTVITKDLTSIDLSSKFSMSMLKDKTKNVTCFVVDEKINVGEAKDAVLFQIGVKFKTGIIETPELAVIYAIG